MRSTRLHPAIEIPDSRFADFVSAGAAQIIADNACAHLFVLGAPTTANWRALDLVEEKPVITLRGKQFIGHGKNVLGDPRIALAWLANELSSARHNACRAGQIVTTGTCHPPLPIQAGDLFEADFGSLGKVSVEIQVDWRSRSGSTLRCPKIAEPTRTCVAPNWIAIAKSALMPIDRVLQPVARGDLRGQREMRRRRILDRRNAHQAGNRQAVFVAAAGDEGIRLRRRDAGLLRLLAGVELDEQFAAAAFANRFPWLTLRKCSAGPPNGWRRTAPRLPSPCWIAAARSDAARCRGKPTSTPAISLWPPARDFRRIRAVRPRSPARSRRRRMSWTPRSASPTRDRGALPCRRARSRAPPRRARLVKTGLSATAFSGVMSSIAS